MTEHQCDYVLTSDLGVAPAPDSTLEDLIRGVVLEHLQKEDELIEAAITQGDLLGCGAAVVRDELTTKVRVDARVPKQNVFHFPSPAAYEAWVERGTLT